jgi:hypothetical protein
MAEYEAKGLWMSPFIVKDFSRFEKLISKEEVVEAFQSFPLTGRRRVFDVDGYASVKYADYCKAPIGGLELSLWQWPKNSLKKRHPSFMGNEPPSKK